MEKEKLIRRQTVEKEWQPNNTERQNECEHRQKQ
jgi:hypothetical protein